MAWEWAQSPHSRSTGWRAAPRQPTGYQSFRTSGAEDLHGALPRAIGLTLIDLHVVATLLDRATVGGLNLDQVRAGLVRETVVLFHSVGRESDLGHAGSNPRLPIGADLVAPDHRPGRGREEMGVGCVHRRGSLRITAAHGVGEGLSMGGDRLRGP